MSYLKEKTKSFIQKHLFKYTFVKRKYAEFIYLKRNINYRRKCKFQLAKYKNVMYFVIDPRYKHTGLADRLKSIITVYNIAKLNDYDFKIIFKNPFKLEDYLQPTNKSNSWIADFSDLEYSVTDTVFYNEIDWKNNFRLKKNKQYHCYNYLGNRLPKTFPESGFNWNELFSELFKPAPILLDKISSYNLNEGCYIAVQLRFANLLEHFEEGMPTIENLENKTKLILKCKKAISRICDNNKYTPVLVFSDSKTFLDSLNDLPIIILDSKNIGHISFDKNAVLKTFVDLFMISRAKCVYQIVSNEMYQSSCFAMCGARIGGIPFERIYV